MFKSLAVLAFLVGVALCSGCASIVGGQNQSVSVVTTRDGADVAAAECSLQNDKGSWLVTTPGSVTVHRSYKDLLVTCATAPAEPNVMLVKSSTKALAFGNVLIGGVVGAGVDMATGAAYDYPNLIAVALSASGKSAPAAPPVASSDPPAAPWAGSRLFYAESDVASGASQGESVFVVDEIGASRRAFNDGAIVCRADGTPEKGVMHAALIYGAGPVEIKRGGTWSGTFRASGFDDVPAQFTYLGKQTKVISGRSFAAARLKVEGFATRTWTVGQSATNSGAPFEGEMLVDSASGLVLEITVRSRHPSYAVHRELVRVASS